nr:MAG TPA: hypothetical protein [Caudoviricetes sp.]
MIYLNMSCMRASYLRMNFISLFIKSNAFSRMYISDISLIMKDIR